MKIIHRSDWQPPHKFYHGLRIRCHKCDSHLEMEDSDGTPTIDMRLPSNGAACTAYIFCPVCRNRIDFTIRSEAGQLDIWLREENELPESSMDPGEGYHLLAYGDFIRNGDEVWESDLKSWTVCYFGGDLVREMKVRRKIKNQSSPEPESGTAAPTPENSPLEPPH